MSVLTVSKPEDIFVFILLLIDQESGVQEVVARNALRENLPSGFARPD